MTAHSPRMSDPNNTLYNFSRDDDLLAAVGNLVEQLQEYNTAAAADHGERDLDFEDRFEDDMDDDLDGDLLNLDAPPHSNLGTSNPGTSIQDAEAESPYFASPDSEVASQDIPQPENQSIKDITEKDDRVNDMDDEIYDSEDDDSFDKKQFNKWPRWRRCIFIVVFLVLLLLAVLILVIYESLNQSGQKVTLPALVSSPSRKPSNSRTESPSRAILNPIIPVDGNLDSCAVPNFAARVSVGLYVNGTTTGITPVELEMLQKAIVDSYIYASVLACDRPYYRTWSSRELPLILVTRTDLLQVEFSIVARNGGPKPFTAFDASQTSTAIPQEHQNTRRYLYSENARELYTTCPLSSIQNGSSLASCASPTSAGYDKNGCLCPRDGCYCRSNITKSGPSPFDFQIKINQLIDDIRYSTTSGGGKRDLQQGSPLYLKGLGYVVRVVESTTVPTIPSTRPPTGRPVQSPPRTSAPINNIVPTPSKNISPSHAPIQISKPTVPVPTSRPVAPTPRPVPKAPPPVTAQPTPPSLLLPPTNLVDDNTASFEIFGVARDCSWVRQRSYDFQVLICDPNLAARVFCRKTCESLR